MVFHRDDGFVILGFSVYVLDFDHLGESERETHEYTKLTQSKTKQYLDLDMTENPNAN